MGQFPSGRERRASVIEELWHAGYVARCADRSIGCNPEPRPAYPDHKHWRDGWEAADRELREVEQRAFPADELTALLRSCLEHDRQATLSLLSEELTMTDLDGLQARLP